MNNKPIDKTPKRVLVFNPLKKLVAIFQSHTAAANAFDATTTQIMWACNGVKMSCRGYYFRVVDPEIEIEWDDLGVLRIEEYDELCGVKRKYYTNGKMSRKGMKYKKKQKNESTSNQQKQQ